MIFWLGLEDPPPYCDKIPTFMGSSKANWVLVNFEKKLGLGQKKKPLKALYTEPSKSQYSISPLVLVIFKSPTPTVVDTTLVTLVITILPLVITISPLNNPTCTNGRCKLL